MVPLIGRVKKGSVSIFLTSQVNTTKDVSAKLSQSLCIILAQILCGILNQDVLLLSLLLLSVQVCCNGGEESGGYLV